MTDWVWTGAAANDFGSDNPSWDDPGNWQNDVVPVILAGDVVTLLPVIFWGAGGGWNIAFSATVGGTFVNAGTITLGSVDFDDAHGAAGISSFDFLLGADTSLTGGGAIVMNASGYCEISGPYTLENVNETIEGSGCLGGTQGGALTGGSNAAITLVNDAGGTIEQTGAGQLIVNGVVANSGLIEATGPGGLAIDGDGRSGVIDQSGGGTLFANGGDIDLKDADSVEGGTLESAGGGEVIDVVSLDGGGAHPVTIDAGTIVAAGDAFSFTAGAGAVAAIDNHGEIDLTAAGGGNIILGSGAGSTVEFAGGGTVLLQSAQSGIYGPATLDNIGNTFAMGGQDEGSGTVPGGVTLGVVTDNQAQGVIEAVGQGDVLNLDASVANSGAIEALGGATLNIWTTVDQTGGGALLANGGTVAFGDTWHSADIVGGALTGENGGGFEIAGGATLDGTGPGGLTISQGTQVSAAGGQLDLAAANGQTASIVNRGVISVGPGGLYGPSLVIGSGGAGGASTVRLSGGGVVSLNVSYFVDGLPGGVATLENVDNVIEGYGQIGSAPQIGAGGNDDLLLVNDAGGVIEANDAGARLLIATGDAFVNNGALQADGGTLQVDDAVSGTGSASIEGGGALTLLSAFNQNVAFAGAGKLTLSQAYGGEISGFGAGDVIDIADANLSGDTWSFDGETLDILGPGGAVAASLNFSRLSAAAIAGDSAQFALRSDGASGADITFAYAPTLTIASAGGLTGSTSQTITGTINAANAGLTISIYDGTTLLGTTTANAAGLWSFAATLPLVQGAHAITAEATDASGNLGKSAAVVYDLDTMAPTLTFASSGGPTNTRTQALSGGIDVADAGQPISIYDGTTLLGTTTANAEGAWSFSATLLATLGAQTITAVAANPAGVIGTSDPLSFTLEALPPTISGAAAGQTTRANAPIKPFAQVKIADPTGGARETLTITLGGGAGALAGAGLNGGSGGVYTLTGSASAVTSELEALSFTPATPADTKATTTFALSDQSSAYGSPVVDTTTTVVSNDGAAGPVTLTLAQALTYAENGWTIVSAAGAAVAPEIADSGAHIAAIGAAAAATLVAAGDTILTATRAAALSVAEAELLSNAGILLAGASLDVSLASGQSLTLGKAADETIVASGGGAISLAGNGKGGAADALHASGAPINEGAASNLTLIGSHDSIAEGAGSALSLTGADDSVHAAAGDSVAVSGNGRTGVADVVYLSNGSITVGANSHVVVIGSDDVIAAGADDVLSVTGTGDRIAAGAGSAVAVSSGGANGPADSVALSNGSVSAASNSLLNVSGAHATVTAGQNCTLGVTGYGDHVSIGAAGALSLTVNGTGANAHSGDVVQCGPATQAQLTGNGNTGANTTLAMSGGALVESANTSASVSGTGFTVEGGANDTIGAAGSGFQIAGGANDAISATDSGQGVVDAGAGTTVNVDETGAGGASQFVVDLAGGGSIVQTGSGAIAAQGDHISLRDRLAQSLADSLEGKDDSATVARDGKLDVDGDGDTAAGGDDAIVTISGGVDDSVTSGQGSQVIVDSDITHVVIDSPDGTVTLGNGDSGVSATSSHTAITGAGNDGVSVSGQDDPLKANDSTYTVTGGVTAGDAVTGSGNVSGTDPAGGLTGSWSWGSGEDSVTFAGSYQTAADIGAKSGFYAGTLTETMSGAGLAAAGVATGHDPNSDLSALATEYADLTGGGFPQGSPTRASVVQTFSFGDAAGYKETFVFSDGSLTENVSSAGEALSFSGTGSYASVATTLNGEAALTGSWDWGTTADALTFTGTYDAASDIRTVFGLVEGAITETMSGAALESPGQLSLDPASELALIEEEYADEYSPSGTVDAQNWVLQSCKIEDQISKSMTTMQTVTFTLSGGELIENENGLGDLLSYSGTGLFQPIASQMNGPAH